MKLQPICRSAILGALFALCASLPAAATPLNESGLGVRRGVWSTPGSGIAHMVAETIQIRAISMETPSGPVTGVSATLAFVDIALDRIPTAGRAGFLDSFPGASPASEAKAPAFAATAQGQFQSPDALLAPGTSTISVAGAKRLQPWKLVPDQSERFLQVAIGMMAVGFLPATLRRSR